MSNKVGQYNIEIIQGSDTNNVNIVPTEDDGKPISLEFYTARMQIRPTHNSPTILDELTTENDRITIIPYTEDDLIYYRITVIFPSAITTKYTFTNALYDLEVVSSSGTVFRWIEGTVTVCKEITK